MFSHLSKFSVFCAQVEIEHVIATVFQPGERSEISAQVETFYSSRDFLFRVEIFTSCRDFFFFFFLVTDILSQVENFFFMSRFFISSRDFSSCRDVSIQVDIFQFKARVEMLPRISCWHLLPKINHETR